MSKKTYHVVEPETDEIIEKRYGGSGAGFEGALSGIIAIAFMLFFVPVVAGLGVFILILFRLLLRFHSDPCNPRLLSV